MGYIVVISHWMYKCFYYNSKPAPYTCTRDSTHVYLPPPGRQPAARAPLVSKPTATGYRQRRRIIWFGLWLCRWIQLFYFGGINQCSCIYIPSRHASERGQPTWPALFSSFSPIAKNCSQILRSRGCRSTISVSWFIYFSLKSKVLLDESAQLWRHLYFSILKNDEARTHVFLPPASPPCQHSLDVSRCGLTSLAPVYYRQ